MTLKHPQTFFPAGKNVRGSQSYRSSQTAARSLRTYQGWEDTEQPVSCGEKRHLMWVLHRVFISTGCVELKCVYCIYVLGFRGGFPFGFKNIHDVFLFSITCLIPVKQPSAKTWRLERKAHKEGKPLPPKGTPYVWTLEPRAKRMQLPKVSQNLLWMCWLLKMIEG